MLTLTRFCWIAPTLFSTVLLQRFRMIHMYVFRCLIKNSRRIADESKQENCTCTRQDYDWSVLKKVVYIGLLFTELWSCCFSSDYGYYLHEDECIEDPDFKGPNLHICLRNHEYEIVSKGYVLNIIILSWPA